ncbi:hypothetical protein [Noviherbaspirillum suwonense]|jgi:hypothetical protein|uniref:MotA/TolQ/ExbB proton channel domain-containing protein n=1 Tax=Noviherbaspirillum suwonense TaxID=1224511 RepID=A0ABY1QM84_9BURK|nr:hypothetical protein [Noviherbaspirillum suwonense]SMP73497.1 hypothetical protein SAMN06295970_11993 [Noviherbaspirillum suwonense]
MKRDAAPALEPMDPASAYTLLLAWAAFAGVLMFAATLLWQNGVWGMLIEADPTGITMIIVAVFVAATVRCGWRSLRLCDERASMEAWRRGLQGICGRQGRHVDAYFRALLAQWPQDAGARGRLADVLAERLHGPEDSTWWVNGIQIKLGLLGKVIGFSILAIQISRLESFDPSQTQDLLKTLTGGLGIALLTTAVGLVANMLLGLQLTQLDRCADILLADATQFADTGLLPDLADFAQLRHGA